MTHAPAAEEPNQALHQLLAGEEISHASQVLAQHYGGGEWLSGLFAGAVQSPSAPSELIDKLLAWQQTVDADEVVVGVLGRAVEVLLGEVYDPALEALMHAAAERRSGPQASAVQAQYHFAQAALASLRDGEQAFESPFVQGLALLMSNDLPWRQRLQQYALFMAFRGRLAEISSLLPEDLEQPDDIDLDFGAESDADWEGIRFINAIECGRIDEAAARAPALAEAAMTPALEELVAAYDEILMLWQQEVLRLPSAEATAGSEEELARSLRALINADRRALFAMIEASTYEDVASASTLFGYYSLRIALALRDQELAADLLQQRRELGMHHWLDGFLEARIALLQGEPQAASDHFCRCLRLAELHGAVDRLDFEMRLALELLPMQVVWLGHRIQETPSVHLPLNPLLSALQGDTGG